MKWDCKVGLISGTQKNFAGVILHLGTSFFSRSSRARICELFAHRQPLASNNKIRVSAFHLQAGSNIGRTHYSSESPTTPTTVTCQ